MGLNDINNVRLGVCSIVYNSVNLGHTKGGVTLKGDRKFETLNVDKYGSMPIDMVLNGNELTVEANFAEPVIDQLRYAMGEGDYQSGAQGKRLGIGGDAGYSMRNNAAAQLVLHPLSKAASDTSEDVVIYKAVSTAPLELNYRINEQRVYKVTFTALVDESYGTNRRLGHIGLTNVS